MRRKNATNEAILARTSFDTMDIEYMAGLEGKVGCHSWIDAWSRPVARRRAARWDRTESIDTVVLSFPGWAGLWRDARIPLAAIEHSHVIKNTTHDTLAILKWSLFQAFLGQYPQSRHDGTPWTKADDKRKRLAGGIGCQRALIRITSDWKMWKEIFKCPQWYATAGCCFRCAREGSKTLASQHLGGAGASATGITSSGCARMLCPSPRFLACPTLTSRKSAGLTGFTRQIKESLQIT